MRTKQAAPEEAVADKFTSPAFVETAGNATDVDVYPDPFEKTVKAPTPDLLDVGLALIITGNAQSTYIFPDWNAAPIANACSLPDVLLTLQ